MAKSCKGGVEEDDNFSEADFDWSTTARQEALHAAEEAKRQGALRLGIDFGNVIVSAHEDGVFFKRSASGDLEDVAEPCPGARDGVRALVRLFKREHVFIVSRARSRVARATLDWLQQSSFAKDTGLLVDEGHVFFVHGRVDKRYIVEQLGITHFIDDRISVLRSLGRCSQRVLLRAPWVAHDDRHETRGKKAMEGKVVAHSWSEVVGLVRKWFKASAAAKGANAAPKGGAAGARGALGGATAAAAEPAQLGVMTPTSANHLLSGLPHLGGLAAPAFPSHAGLLPADSYGLPLPEPALPPPGASSSLAERCAWLEGDSARLRLYHGSLMQVLTCMEADVTNVDMLLQAQEAEGAAIQERLALLERTAAAAAPGTTGERWQAPAAAPTSPAVPVPVEGGAGAAGLPPSTPMGAMLPATPLGAPPVMLPTTPMQPRVPLGGSLLQMPTAPLGVNGGIVPAMAAYAGAAIDPPTSVSLGTVSLMPPSTPAGTSASLAVGMAPSASTVLPGVLPEAASRMPCASPQGAVVGLLPSPAHRAPAFAPPLYPAPPSADPCQSAGPPPPSSPGAAAEPAAASAPPRPPPSPPPPPPPAPSAD